MSKDKSRITAEASIELDDIEVTIDNNTSSRKATADSEDEKGSSSGFSSDSSNYESSSGSSSDEEEINKIDYVRKHILKAVNSGDLDKLQNILNSRKFKRFSNEILNGSYKDRLSNLQTTIFIEIVKKGNADLVRQFIEKGANCSVNTIDNSNNPFLAALTTNPANLEIISNLIANSEIIKLNINEPILDDHPRPLYYALLSGKQEIVDLLVSQGADMSLPPIKKKGYSTDVQLTQIQDNFKTNDPMAFLAVNFGYKVKEENYFLYDEKGEPLIYQAINSGRPNSELIELLSKDSCEILPSYNPDAGNIYEVCLNNNNFYLADFIAKQNYNGATVFDRMNYNEFSLNALELFAVDGSIRSKKFIKKYGGIKKEEELEKFIKFSKEKYILNFSYSSYDNGEIAENKNLLVAKVAKDLFLESKRDIAGKNNIILKIFDMILSEGKESLDLDEDGVYLKVNDVNYNDHVAYFIQEIDKNTNNIKSISYCDGLCSGPSEFHKDNKIYKYGAITFFIDQKKVEGVTDFDKMLKKMFEGPYLEANDFGDVISNIAFCDEDDNLQASESIITLPQSRGNCAFKSLKITIDKILSLYDKSLVFDVVDQETNSFEFGDAHNSIHKEFKKVFIEDIIENFKAIVNSPNYDDLIKNSALESLKMAFLKTIEKGNYEYANNILSVFNGLTYPVDIVKIKNQDGENIEEIIDIIEENYFNMSDEEKSSSSAIVSIDLVHNTKLYIQKLRSEEIRHPSTEISSNSGRAINADKMFEREI